MIGIYKLTNNITNKSYIGQSINIARRIKEHKNNIKNRKTPLYLSINKYGWNNFTVEVLYECLEDNLNSLEISNIEKHNTIAPNGYNITIGGQGGQTFEWTAIKRKNAKIRAENSLVNYSNNRKGCHNTAAHNKKISAARLKTNGMRGRKHSIDHNSYMSNLLKYNTYNTEIVQMINTQCGSTQEFRGLTDAAEQTGINRATIWYRIKHNVIKGNIKFQYKAS